MLFQNQRVMIQSLLRPFATVPSLAEKGTDWNKKTELFLANAVGSMTLQDRDAAEDAIAYWTRLKTREATDKAWRILDRLVEEAKHIDKHGDSASKVRKDKNSNLLNRIVNAWRLSIPSGARVQQQSKLSLLEAEEVLSRLDRYTPYVLPNAQTYGMIIDAVCRLGENSRVAAQFAEEVMERMHRESMTNPLVYPTVITYGNVIKAWANSGDPAAAKRAEAILERMHELYQAGNVDVKPNAICFNTVISAWANSGDPAAAKRAEAILERMQELYEAGNVDVKPDTISFNTVLSAWANSRDPAAAKRAEAILERMQELYEAGNVDVKPDTISFSTVISAWARSRDPGCSKASGGNT